MLAGRALSVVALLLGAACGGGAQTRLGGDHFSLQIAEDGLTLELSRNGTALVRLPADAFQLGVVNRLDETLSYDPYWLEYEDELFRPDPPSDLRFRAVRSVVVREEGDAVVLEQTFEGGATAELSVRADAEGRFSMMWRPTSSTPIALMRLRLRANDAAFYGLGEHLDDVNSRGKLRPMQMEADLSIEGGNNEAHVPVPLLIGSTGWGVFVASERLGLFDVARKEEDLVEVTYATAEASGDGLSIHLFAADHPLDVTRRYYDVTGDPLLPARWAYGPWIWRDENQDQAEVLDDIRKIRELELPTSGIWIDRPYATAVNTFDFAAAQFPDPAGMIAAAHAAGLRVALWHTPYLATAAEALRQEARDKGFFPPQPGLRLNGWSDPIDFTNPDAYAWWQGLVRRYTDLGIEGFKLDYAEDVLPGIGGARTEWKFADGRDERTMHYGYTVLYHRVYAETLPASGGFLLGRAGRWGDQKNVSVIWPGDLDADLSVHRERVQKGDGSSYVAVGGLPASVIMGLTLGPSGFPFFGADTGGYRHSPPDEETYVRWFQQTALSSVMQVGDSSSQPPWVYTEENGRSDGTLALYRRYAQLHLRLFPYAWTYAERLAVDGRPLQRSLGLAHPELGVHPSDTYLFGDDLLVAPVLGRGQRARTVHFPAGEWFDWWDGRSQMGGVEVEVEAPLDRLPLFARAGALIPMLRPDADTLATATDEGVESATDDPGLLWVRAFPGEGSFTVYDGTTLQQTANDGLRVVYRGGDEYRTGIVLEVYRAAAPTRVESDGTPINEVPDEASFESSTSGWRFADGRLWVKLSGPAHQIEVR